MTGVAQRGLASKFDAQSGAPGPGPMLHSADRIVMDRSVPAGEAAELQKKLILWSGDLSQFSGLRIVKNARRRTVAFATGQAPFPNLYIKQERILGAWNRIRTVFQPAHARLEYDNSRELQSRGVAAPRVLAFAEWTRAGFVILTVSVLEELAGGAAADDYFINFTGAELERRLDAAARELAVLHRSGVDLTDCHRKNLLISEREGAASSELTLQISLLDIATVKFHVMTQTMKAARVAQLLHSLEPVLTAAERAKFAELYALHARIPSVSVDTFARRVRDIETVVSKTRDRSRDKRSLTNSTEFAVERSLGRRVFRRRDTGTAEVSAALSLTNVLHKQSHKSESGRIIKIDGRTECYEVNIDNKKRFIKIVRAASPFHAFADAIRGSRGRRAWFAGNALVRRGIAAPRPLALVETGFLLPFQSLQIVEWIEGAETLANFTKTFRAHFKTWKEKRDFIDTFAWFAAELHRARVDHGDLALKNFLVRKSADSFNYQFWILDLEAVESLGGELPRDRLLRALMQLDEDRKSVV